MELNKGKKENFYIPSDSSLSIDQAIRELSRVLNYMDKSIWCSKTRFVKWLQKKNIFMKLSYLLERPLSLIATSNDCESSTMALPSGCITLSSDAISTRRTTAPHPYKDEASCTHGFWKRPKKIFFFFSFDLSLSTNTLIKINAWCLMS